MTHYITVNGTHHRLDDNEGRPEWPAGDLPRCECGEDLIEDTGIGRRPVVRSAWHDEHYVACWRCEREYRIEEDWTPRTEADAVALIIGGAKVTVRDAE